MRDPYASLLLHGIKTVETRSHGMLQGLRGPCLLHVGHKTMAEAECAEFLWSSGLAGPDDIERLMRPPPGMPRGQVLGIVELGETRLCGEEEQRSLQKAVASEVVGRFATDVLRAWWLPRPVRVKGQPGVWRTSVPAQVLPPALHAVLPRAAPAPPSPAEMPDRLPRLIVFDLDGVVWSPEMYQTRGGAPYRIASEGVAINSTGEEIFLHDAVLRVWSLLLRLSTEGHGIRVAVASSSRRNKAIPLLKAMPVAPGTCMMDLVSPDLFEMYYRKGEGKRPHVQAILEKSGVPPDQVLFLDDNLDNVRSVQDLGVTACHVPNGLSEAAWAEALGAFHAGSGVVAGRGARRRVTSALSRPPRRR